LFLRFVAEITAKVISTHKAAEQEHGGELHSDQVWAVEGHADLLRLYDVIHVALGSRA